MKEVPNKFKLPSRFQIDDEVTLNFNQAGVVYNCQIIKVHFTESKVLYDVQILTKMGDVEIEPDTYEGEVTRIYNIDSCFVINALEEPKES